ncbi:MAG: glycosyl hydrolase, partial [Muriicola sp.]|nr:glycosyl hydrolase [Muriicola sp.]
TLTTISESPFKFGLLYTGSDDGLIQMSSNAGGSWNVISNSLPQNFWVSRVAASKHKKERVYASLNGYRWDNFEPFIYKSDDYGNTWQSIASNLPASPVNVILEDPVNDQLLFAGTDNGLYVSLDQGQHWDLFQNGIPNVAVHDLVIQSEAKHLVVGTHGRSIYKADIALLQQMDSDMLSVDLLVFDIPEIKHSSRWGNSWSSWSEPYTPGIDIAFYTRKKGEFSAKISTQDGIEVSAFDLEADKGFNILSYDVAFSKQGKSEYLKKYKVELKTADDGKTYLPKGTYELMITGNGKEEKRSIVID